jgi:hypothetical protein
MLLHSIHGHVGGVLLLYFHNRLTCLGARAGAAVHGRNITQPCSSIHSWWAVSSVYLQQLPVCGTFSAVPCYSHLHSYDWDAV